MSFIDLGGGGGDSGAGGKSTPTGASGTGFDPSAGYTGPSGQDYMGTGLPSTDVGTSPYLGDPSAAAQGYSGAYNVPQQDPNVTVPESQAPTPGTTSTSIGGVPSDQPAGGRAQASIGPIGTGFIQQLLKSLGVGQGGGGGPVSPTLGQVSQQDAAQGYTSGTGQDFMSGTQAPPDSPQAEGPQSTSPGQPTPDEAGQMGPQGPAGQAQRYPSLEDVVQGQQQTAGGAQRYPSAADVTQGQQEAGGQAQRYPSTGDVTQGQQEATAGQAQRYPPQGTQPQVSGPPAKKDPAAAPPAAPAAPASTGPVSSRGTYDPNQAQGGQQNPFQQFLRGLFDVLTGNTRDLQQLAKEQSPGYDWRTDTGRPGDPWYGKPMTPGYEDPTRTTSGQPPGGQPKLTEEQRQQQQREQDLGKPGTYVVDKNGNRVRVKTDAQGNPQYDQNGDPIPAEDTATTGQPGGQPGAGTPQENNSYVGGLGGHSTLNGQRTDDMSRLNPDFANRLAAAGRAYKQETGQDPQYGEGYRDDATQRQYYIANSQKPGGIAAHPTAKPASMGGRGSLHQRGTAMDIPSGGFARWLQQGNAQRFGLGNPVPNDPNHFQMVNLRGQQYPYAGQTGGTPTAGTASGPGAHYTNDAAIAQAINIESSGNPNERTGSNYGLLQFSPDQFQHFGITNWRDPQQQIRAYQQEVAENTPTARSALGRDPTSAELYLMHQQGAGGLALIKAAQNNPDAPAWETIKGFSEYRNNPGKAVKAISGNIPSTNPLARVPGTQITNKQFVDMWNQRFGGDTGTAQQPQPQPTAPLPRVRGYDLLPRGPQALRDNQQAASL